MATGPSSSLEDFLTVVFGPDWTVTVNVRRGKGVGQGTQVKGSQGTSRGLGGATGAGGRGGRRVVCGATGTSPEVPPRPVVPVAVRLALPPRPAPQVPSPPTGPQESEGLPPLGAQGEAVAALLSRRALDHLFLPPRNASARLCLRPHRPEDEGIRGWGRWIGRGGSRGPSRPSPGGGATQGRDRRRLGRTRRLCLKGLVLRARGRRRAVPGRAPCGAGEPRTGQEDRCPGPPDRTLVSAGTPRSRTQGVTALVCQRRESSELYRENCPPTPWSHTHIPPVNQFSPKNKGVFISGETLNSIKEKMNFGHPRLINLHGY